MKTITEVQATELFDEMLDDCYGDVEIAGIKFSTSRALFKIDPIAYRCGMLDYADSQGLEVE
jgi:hypothetical protein